MKKQIIEKLEELRDLLGLEENEKTSKQIIILTEALEQYYFTESQFNYACKTIVKETKETYGKMPNVGAFLQAMSFSWAKVRTKEDEKKHFLSDRFKFALVYTVFINSMLDADKRCEGAFNWLVNDEDKQEKVNNIKSFFNIEKTEDLKSKMVKLCQKPYEERLEIFFKMYFKINKKKAQSLNLSYINLTDQKRNINKICNGNVS
jgi:hypothetical protein